MIILQGQRVGFVLLVVSILLFIEAIDRMDWWDQADKEYERECLPNNNPQPDTELCTELQNEANYRMRIFLLYYLPQLFYLLLVYPISFLQVLITLDNHLVVDSRALDSLMALQLLARV